MTQLVDVKVKDQYSQTYNVKAQLRQVPENSEAERLDLFKRIEHIVVDGEVILPSIELLFESRGFFMGNKCRVKLSHCSI